MIFAGVDWAEAHHDVHFQDEQGRRLGGGRLPEGVEGIARFHALAAAHASDPAQVVIGIETDRGLFVNALAAAGYQVLAVNPMSASRYRDRHSSSGAKSDPGDAKVLADLVRTGRHNHRLVAADSGQVLAIRALARGHQAMIWARRAQANQLRSALREFYPAALAAFDDLTSGDAVAVLKAAPQPVLGAALSRTQITAALRRGGRTRRLAERTAVIQAALRAPQQAPDPALAAAMGIQVAALAAVIAEMSTQIAVLEQQLEADFEAHPDAQVVRSLPGLGTILGARVLGESGDAPHRYATATCRKLRRHITGDPRLGQETSRAGPPRRNRRLADAIYLWAFSSITTSLGARAFYDTRRAAGDTHHQGPARPGQPPRRHPARLPDPPHPLQRAHRLASASVRQPCKPGTPRSERWQRVGLPPAQRLAGQLWISPDASKKVRHPAPRQTVCPWPASPGRFRIPSTLLRTTADSGSVTVDVT